MALLNYNHLRYFWAIAHDGSLTRAAERLNLSQSALSVQLKKLETPVGHPLFVRAGKRLSLTEAGRIALDYADTVFKTGDEMMSTLQGRPAENRQMLRVGALTTLSRNFQLEFLRPLVGRNDVELIVRSGTMRELLEQLKGHALDVVLANRPADRDIGIPLQSHLLDKQPVSLVGRPISEGSPRFAFPADLAAEPMILPSRESEMRVDFDRMLDLAGVQPFVLAEVDDMAMLRLLARESGAISLVPPIVVRDELQTGVLVERYIIPDFWESFYALVQKRRFPNPLVEQLLSRSSRGTARDIK
jgi:LysR family transcriptional activator of nhaA